VIDKQTFWRLPYEVFDPNPTQADIEAFLCRFQAEFGPARLGLESAPNPRDSSVSSINNRPG
jgi:hypothetical protein